MLRIKPILQDGFTLWRQISQNSPYQNTSQPSLQDGSTLWRQISQNSPYQNTSQAAKPKFKMWGCGKFVFAELDMSKPCKNNTSTQDRQGQCHCSEFFYWVFWQERQQTDSLLLALKPKCNIKVALHIKDMMRPYFQMRHTTNKSAPMLDCSARKQVSTKSQSTKKQKQDDRYSCLWWACDHWKFNSFQSMIYWETVYRLLFPRIRRACFHNCWLYHFPATSIWTISWGIVTACYQSNHWVDSAGKIFRSLNTESTGYQTCLIHQLHNLLHNHFTLLILPSIYHIAMISADLALNATVLGTCTMGQSNYDYRVRKLWLYIVTQMLLRSSWSCRTWQMEHWFCFILYDCGKTDW